MQAIPGQEQKAAYYRLSGYYILFFAVYGIAIPLWPRWLEGFLSVKEVGIVLAVAYWLKLVFVPLTAQIAQSSGRRKPVLIVLAGIVLGCLALLPLTQDWLLIALIWGVGGAALTTIVPLSDGMTVLASQKLGLDFGRTRLWGSLSFIVISLVVGWIVDLLGRGSIYDAILIASAVLFLFSFMLPELSSHEGGAEKPSFLASLSLKNFPLFIVTTALLLATHAALYGFASIHWKRAGYDNIEITLFWVIGVVVEIIVFSKGSALIAKAGAMPMIALSAIGGIVRWILLGSYTSPLAVIFAQCLHGATFALLYIAVMAYIAKRVPQNIAPSAQGLYDALAMGVFFGLFTIMSGYLYALNPAYAFYAMSALSVIGLGLSFILLRRVRAAEAI